MELELKRGARAGTLPFAGGLAAGLLILLGLGLLFVNERLYQAQRVREVEVQARILAASTMAAVDFGDRESAGDAVRALSANPQIQFAAVYDRSGARFAAFSRNGSAAPAFARGVGAASPGAVIGTSEISSAGKRIGSVAIGTVRKSLFRKITRYGLIGLFVLLAAVLAAILGLAEAASRRANRALTAQAVALVEANQKLADEMEERARAEDQLRQSQKMQALGQLTGGIAHDFNNLLTVIQGSAEMLKRPGLAEEKRARYTAAIGETAARAAALTSQLLAFARRQPLRPQLLDLADTIRAMEELLDRTLGERVEVKLDLAENGCTVTADLVQLENALLNIAVNARDAMPEGGTLTIRVRPSDEPLETGPAIDIEMTDTGSGIDQEALARVFEPFFTTKELGKGTGLGLSQVYGFAAQSGGRVAIESRKGEGTTVRLSLPCAAGEAAASKRSENRASVPRPTLSKRILVVDDNENVGALAEALLTELGHSVLRAGSAVEALAILERERPDIIFSDIVMPGMSGIELAEHLALHHPDLSVILTTGYSNDLSGSRVQDLPLLLKPYGLDAIRKILERASR